jgi:hypothetical protein
MTDALKNICSRFRGLIRRALIWLGLSRLVCLGL